MVWWRSDAAEEDAATDKQVIEDQDNTWGQDRLAVNGQWTGLVGEFGGQYGPPAITATDGFPAMTHQQIWDKLQGVDAALINDTADTWRNLAEHTETGNQDFLKAVNQDLDTGWNGQSGTAAVNGVREFSNSLTPLVASFRMVAVGLDLIEGHLAQAKASVGKPDDDTVGDKITSWLLDDDVFKTPQYRKNEAEESARWVMTEYYEPGAAGVDSKTPVLPEPVKPVDDGSQPPGSQPPVTTTTGTSTSTGTNTGSPTATDEGTDPEGQQQQSAGQEDPQSTTPQSTTPASTTPASTTPALPTTPTTTGAPPTTPGAPAGVPAGTPSGTPQTTAPIPPGQTVQGIPGKPAGAPATPAGTSTGNKPGRMGMPGGMGAPGARGNQGGDENEHDIPDYLIYDRGSELLGTQPPALPPGGVIGG